MTRQDQIAAALHEAGFEVSAPDNRLTLSEIREAGSISKAETARLLAALHAQGLAVVEQMEFELLRTGAAAMQAELLARESGPAGSEPPGGNNTRLGLPTSRAVPPEGRPGDMGPERTRSHHPEDRAHEPLATAQPRSYDDCDCVPGHRLKARVLVCGGRDYDDARYLAFVMDGLVAGLRVGVIIEGEAPGADTLARDWARSRSIPVAPYPADWRGQGKAAGPIRNQRMLDEGKPDLVIAFPGGRGTQDMVRRSRDAGVATWVMPEDEHNIDSLVMPRLGWGTEGDASGSQARAVWPVRRVGAEMSGPFTGPDDPLDALDLPTAPSATPATDRPTVVCICGSTRFAEEMNFEAEQETLLGKIVVRPEVIAYHAGDDPQLNKPEVKADLDRLHLRKIDLADEVLVVMVDGYIGESTRNEIAYAEQTGKPVRYHDHRRPAAQEHVATGLGCWCHPYRDPADPAVIIHREDARA